MLKHLVALTFALGSLPVMASNLAAPFSFSNSKVLPKGIRNLQYKGLLVQGNERFASDNNIVPLGDALNQQITWNKLIEGKVEDDGQKAGDDLKGYLAAQGVSNLNDEIGTTTGDVNVSVNVHIPVLAYGLTKDLTLAVAVPVFQSEVKIATGVTSSSKIEAIKQSAVTAGAIKDAKEVQEKYNAAIENKLARYGYDPLANQKRTELGDIKLVAKYLVTENKNYKVAIAPEVTFPSGREQDINRAVDVPSGDGQFDVGATVVTDFFLHKAFVLSTDAGYVAQLPDNAERRVPFKSDSALSPDIDSNIDRDLGDRVFANISGHLLIRETLTLSTGFGIQYKQPDKFEGSKYASERYDWLAINSTQNMQSATVGLTFSTIPMFRKKEFAVPLNAVLTHAVILNGKNVTKDPVTAFELSLFF